VTAPKNSSTIAVKTLLLTDLVDSAGLTRRSGDARTAEIVLRHDRLARDLLHASDGREIDKSDGFLLLFDRPVDAVRYALAYHEALARLSEELGIELRARAGIHLGEVSLHENPPEDVARGAKPLEIEGLAKVIAARLTALARSGQTLLGQSVFDLSRRALVGDGDDSQELRWLAHGPYLFQGLEDPVEVFEVGVPERSPLEAPPDGPKARRSVAAGDEITLGWRAAAGQTVPLRPHWTLREKYGEGGFGEVWLAINDQTLDKRIFKFCYRVEQLRALRREVTIFRVLRETLGHRDDIARIVDWNFDESPYFLEIDYTEGGNLAEWAEEQGGIAEVPLEVRLELIAQIAQALDAAHSVGVLHKDVKPSNVLITRGRGGTPRPVLTDFGIGLLTDRSLLAERGLSQLGLAQLGLTELMETASQPTAAGTPLYMAPELHEGKAPTVRSDIYSLGVLLYQVVAGDFSRAVAPGWKRDVGDELLAEDLAGFLDHSPERRPRSALEIAERLRHLDERRERREAERRAEADAQRARRRRRLSAIVASVATVFLVVVSIFAYQATEARREAEERRQQAEGLITYLLGDLQSKLTEVGRLELLQDATERAQLYFDALPEDQLTDLERARQSQALALLGRVQQERGDLDAALEAFHRALAIIEDVSERHPENVEWRSELGAANFRLGRALWEKGEHTSAEGYFGRFLEIAEALARERPEEPARQMDRAYAYSTLGWVHARRGELEAALERFRSALEINRELVANDPENEEFERNLAVNYNAIGGVYESMGRLDEALDLYRQDLEIKRRLVARDPLSSHRQTDLATSHNLVGRVLDAQGEVEAGLEHFRSAVEILEAWVEKDPSNARWRHHLAINRLRIGEGLLTRDRPEEAIDPLASARELLRELVSGESGRASPYRHLARVEIALGRVLLSRGDARESLARARAATELLEPQAEEAFASDTQRAWASRAQLLAARALEALGRPEEAAEARSRVLAIVAGAAASSNNRYLLDPWARALLYDDRIDEARPVIERLFAMGYRDPELFELSRRKIPDLDFSGGESP